MKLKLFILFYLLNNVHTRFIKRIIGGENSVRHTFPNLVIVYGMKIAPRTKMLYTGGIAYNSLWILITAAYAAKIGASIPISTVTVVAGVYSLHDPREPAQIRNVELVHKHHGYNRSELGKSINLGIIKLDTPLHFGEYAAAFPISPNLTYPTGDAIIAGWGASTEGQLETEQAENILQDLEVEIISMTDCKNIIQILQEAKGKKFSDSCFDQFHFCTGSFSPTFRGPTQGDLGSAIMQLNERGRYEVIGIIASSFPNQDFAVYIHLPHFVPWIKSVIIRSTPRTIRIQK